MEILLVGLVLVGIITGWILYQKRQKSRQGTDDQNNESLGLVLSISTDQEYDNYEVLEVNQSQSSDREYELLGHLGTGRISCTCRGFTYTPHDGCVHTKAYIEKHKSDDQRRPLELGGVVSRPTTSTHKKSSGTERRGNIQPQKALGGVVKSAVIPARVGIRINLGPNTTLLVRILDSRLRGNDGNMQLTTLPSTTTTVPQFGQLLAGNRFAEGKATKLSRVWASRHEEVLKVPFLRTVVVILVLQRRVVLQGNSWRGF